MLAMLPIGKDFTIIAIVAVLAYKILKISYLIMTMVQAVNTKSIPSRPSILKLTLEKMETNLALLP